MGFQHMPTIVHEQASAKGGRVQKKKGLAKLPLYKRREIASLGGKARYDHKSRKGAKQTQDHPSDGGEKLGDLFGDVSEQIQERIREENR